jgi:glycosyltransferase involved in cell wall biosynthesis
VHTTIFESDVLGRVACIGTSVPVVTSLVNTSYDPVRLDDPNVTGWKLKMVKEIDGFTARHGSTYFHAISRSVAEASVRDLRIDPQRITVIERGRDPRRLGEPSPDRRAKARAELGLDPDDVVLTTVGRQEYQKGQWILIEAMAAVLRSNAAVRLVLAGRPGSASERLREALRRTPLSDRVTVLGHRDDVPDVLAASDVFVFPSLYEGLGGALLEAMALGLPIVASDLPAIREVVAPGANAELVPAGSSDALSGSLSALVADPERRSAMGARSREIFEERFTLERSAGRMLELFLGVAERGRPAP